MFEKISGAKKPECIVEQVMKSLQNGTLKPGDRLPAESKLAELTGVGRTSVREALSALRLMGVVETKVGDGSYVCAVPNIDSIKNEISDKIRKSKEVFQLQEARSAFECGIVELAAERIDEKHVAAFEQVLDKMRQAAEESCYDDFVAQHKKFHHLIAQSTRNDVIKDTALSFLRIMDQEGWRDLEKQYYLPGTHEFLQESVEIHQAIFQALREKDAVQATELMKKHFVRYR